MLEKVLFPVIMTDLTEQMIDCLGGVVKNGVKEVLLFHVESVSEIAAGNINSQYDEKLLEKWKNTLLDAGVKATYKIVAGVPWIEIVELIEKGDFSFTFMGSHGNSFLDRVFLGSVTENVIHHSSKPVLIYKLLKNSDHEGISAYCRNIFGKILYATDFSETSERCIPYIEKMLADTSQSLTILHVQDMRNLKYAGPDKFEKFNSTDLVRLEDLKKHFEKRGAGRVMSLLTSGYSIPEILNYARSEEATIIVLGKKGKSNIKEMLLGGVAETIIHKSPVPVFLVESSA
ncbi:MAG: universal stress protein [Brevinematales bacterium]|jgi:nucleotide-binding universal stress UspA family protein